jgi:hypothetical protein
MPASHSSDGGADLNRNHPPNGAEYTYTLSPPDSSRGFRMIPALILLDPANFQSPLFSLLKLKPEWSLVTIP